MAKARKILKRANAVRNIRGVTKTMEMIASARFKRTHDQAVAARPYTDRIADLVACLIDRMGIDQMGHPLLGEGQAAPREVLLVLTSNRGLCGAMNPSVLRTATARHKQLIEADYEVLLQVVGKRGVRHFRFRGMELDAAHADLGDVPDYDAISALTDALVESFLAGAVGGVEVAYMQFISAAVQRPVISQILPLTNLPTPAAGRLAAVGDPAPYDFVPSPSEILDQLLPATVRLRMYQCFLDSSVSEQIMRIAAMRNATDSADDMLHELTARYNRMRQTQITTELAEIMGGRIGLE
jgi:F-type H+-transporting ATPase subunit gamma